MGVYIQSGAILLVHLHVLTSSTIDYRARELCTAQDQPSPPPQGRRRPGVETTLTKQCTLVIYSNENGAAQLTTEIKVALKVTGG